MTQSDFRDHFSVLAEGYARHRPGYPDALFTWLAGQATSNARAWDCATGTGQAARGLADHFREVVATDASADQIALAHGPDNVRFEVAPAEAAPLPAASVDLITVAQALHWFDHHAFYAEVRRVLRPGGVLAAWSYNLLTIDAGPIDTAVGRLHAVVDPHWPPERHHVATGYRELPFPFEPLPAPPFAMSAEWTLPDLLGYLGTWSAVRYYREATGEDPLAGVATELQQAWGAADRVRTVRWPLSLRVGR